MRDELPNWSEILKGNRLSEFSHIDQQPLYCDITDRDHDRHAHSAMDLTMDMQEYTCSEQVDRDREMHSFSHNSVSDRNVSSPVTSQNADATVNSEPASPVHPPVDQHSETQH